MFKHQRTLSAGLRVQPWTTWLLCWLSSRKRKKGISSIFKLSKEYILKTSQNTGTMFLPSTHESCCHARAKDINLPGMLWTAAARRSWWGRGWCCWRRGHEHAPGLQDRGNTLLCWGISLSLTLFLSCQGRETLSYYLKGTTLGHFINSSSCPPVDDIACTKAMIISWAIRTKKSSFRTFLLWSMELSVKW